MTAVFVKASECRNTYAKKEREAWPRSGSLWGAHCGGTVLWGALYSMCSATQERKDGICFETNPNFTYGLIARMLCPNSLEFIVLDTSLVLSDSRCNESNVKGIFEFGL